MRESGGGDVRKGKKHCSLREGEKELIWVKEERRKTR